MGIRVRAINKGVHGGKFRKPGTPLAEFEIEKHEDFSYHWMEYVTKKDAAAGKRSVLARAKVKADEEKATDEN